MDGQLLPYLLPRAAIAWLVGCCVAVIAAVGVASLSTTEMAKISLASGLVSAAALLPMSGRVLSLTAGTSLGELLRSGVGLFVAFTFSMAIRMLGTIALFLVCRYQLAANVSEIATLVLGWYGFLTATEIVLLTRKANSAPKPC